MTARTRAKFTRPLFSDEPTFSDLMPAILILDQVAPHISTWLCDQQEAGKISFEDLSEFHCYARIKYGSKHLSIDTKSFFAQEHGVQAAILAHEWRHSRQNLSKPVKFVSAMILTGRRLDYIMEDDARLYEYKVLLAIYGVFPYDYD